MEKAIFYVLIPVYRAEAFLRDCVASVQAQTVQEFRIVLVDDGSPDGSGALCDTLAREDGRIHVLHQENTGPYGARRAAIRYTRAQAGAGDYVLFLDADDSLKPNAMAVLLDTFRSENCDLVVLGEDKVFAGNVLSPFPADKAFTGTVTDKRQLYKIVLQDGWYNPLWKKAVPARLLPEEDHPEYYPIRFGEDLLQSLPMYRDCRKAVFLKDSLYNYTLNPDSATNALGYEKYRCDSTVLRQVREFLRSEDVWTEADFQEYARWERRLVRFQVWTVAKFRTSIQNREKLLEQIRQDGFYGSVIDRAPAKDVTLTLMRRGCLTLLCLLGSAAKTLGNLRRTLRRLGRRSEPQYYPQGEA